MKKALASAATLSLEPLLNRLTLLFKTCPNYKNVILEQQITVFFAQQAQQCSSWDKVNELHESALRWQILLFSRPYEYIDAAVKNDLGQVWHNMLHGLSFSNLLECARAAAYSYLAKSYIQIEDKNINDWDDYIKQQLLNWVGDARVSTAINLGMLDRFGSKTPTAISLSEVLSRDAETPKLENAWQDLSQGTIAFTAATANYFLLQGDINLLEWYWENIAQSAKNDLIYGLKHSDIIAFSQDEKYPTESLIWIYQHCYTSEEIKQLFPCFNNITDKSALLEFILTSDNQEFFESLWQDNAVHSEIYQIMSSGNYRLLLKTHDSSIATVLNNVFLKKQNELIKVIKLGDLRITQLALQLSNVLNYEDIISLTKSISLPAIDTLKQALSIDNYLGLRTAINEKACAWLLTTLFDSKKERLAIIANKEVGIPIVSKILLSSKADYINDIMSMLITTHSNNVPFLNELFTESNYYFFSSESMVQLMPDMIHLAWVIENVFPTMDSRKSILQVADKANNDTVTTMIMIDMVEKSTSIDEVIACWNLLSVANKYMVLKHLCESDFKVLLEINEKKPGRLFWIVGNLFYDEQLKRQDQVSFHLAHSKNPAIITALGMVDPENYLRMIISNCLNREDFKFYFDVFSTSEYKDMVMGKIWEVLSSPHSCKHGILYQMANNTLGSVEFKEWFFSEFVFNFADKETLWNNSENVTRYALATIGSQAWVASDNWPEQRIKNELPYSRNFLTFAIFLKMDIPKVSKVIAENMRITYLAPYLYHNNSLSIAEHDKILMRFFSIPEFNHQRIAQLFENNRIRNCSKIAACLQQAKGFKEFHIQAFVIEGEYRRYRNYSKAYEDEINQLRERIIRIFFENNDETILTNMKPLLTILEYQKPASFLSSIGLFSSQPTVSEEIERHLNSTFGTLCG